MGSARHRTVFPAKRPPRNPKIDEAPVPNPPTMTLHQRQSFASSMPQTLRTPPPWHGPPATNMTIRLCASEQVFSSRTAIGGRLSQSLNHDCQIWQ